MARPIIVQDNQTLQDVVIQATGSIEAAGQFCYDNDIAITDEIPVGTPLIVTDAALALGNAENLRYLAANGIIVATANRSACGVPLGLALGETGVNSQSVVWTVPDEPTNYEYAISTVNEVPGEWLSVQASAGGVTFADLDGSTQYFVFVRNRCSALRFSPVLTVDFVTPSNLSAQIALKPVMQATASIAGNYKISMSATADFIHIHSLLANYIATNKMLLEQNTVYASDGGASAQILISGITNMSSMAANYETPVTPIDTKILWSDLTAPVPTITFRDVNSNTALCAPVIVLDSLWNITKYLIGDISIDVLATSGDSVVLRITRSHAPVSGDDMNLAGLDWSGIALAGIPDPTDAANDNKCIVTLGAGSHTVGVFGYYNSDDGLTDWPVSYLQMVIEVS